MHLRVLSARGCGECTACCDLSEVPGLKVAYEVCPHKRPSGGGNCGIYPSRPEECHEFRCAWLRGHGRAEDRPDLCGVMFFGGREEDRPLGFAIELRPNALATSAASMASELAHKFPYPIIVSAYGARPPHDTGDAFVLADRLLHRAKKIRGAELARLGDDVGLHALRRVGWLSSQ